MSDARSAGVLNVDERDRAVAYFRRMGALARDIDPDSYNADWYDMAVAALTAQPNAPTPQMVEAAARVIAISGTHDLDSGDEHTRRLYIDIATRAITAALASHTPALRRLAGAV